MLPWIVSGGVEKRRTLLAEMLDPAEFEQRVVCLEAVPPLADRIREAGVPIDVVEGSWRPWDLKSMWGVRAIVRRFDPHIVHGAVYEGVTMASLASWGSGAAFVAEEIDYPVTRSRRAHLLLRWLVRDAARLVCVSPSVATFMQEQGGIPARQIEVILNGIPAPAMPPPGAAAAARDALGIGRDAFVIGSVGRMVDVHKRFSVLLRAFARLRSQGRAAHLLLVGGGDDLDRLRELASELGIAAHVTFTGYRADVDLLLATMDVFALVSNRESFGLVIAEAMHMGLPVVCTGVGGMGDVVVEGETALVCPVDDVEAIAAALSRMHDEPELRRAFGEAGRLRARRELGVERYVDEVAALYRRVASGSPQVG